MLFSLGLIERSSVVWARSPRPRGHRYVLRGTRLRGNGSSPGLPLDVKERGPLKGWDSSSVSSIELVVGKSPTLKEISSFPKERPFRSPLRVWHSSSPLTPSK